MLPASRPARFRRRMVSDDYSRAPLFYNTQAGLMMPEPGGGLHRSRSTGHRATGAAAVPNIYNAVIHEEEGPRGRRPVSYVDDERWDHLEHSPFREHSRHRVQAISRDPSPFYNWQSELEREQMRKELEQLRKEKTREEEEDRIKKEMMLEMALKEKKAREEEAKRKEIEKQAIVEFKRKELEEKEKKKKEEEKREKEYRERLQKDLGLSETQVSRIVKNDSQNAVDLKRTTYTKIARRHVSIETLRVYGMPFKVDDVSVHCIPKAAIDADGHSLQHDPDHYVLIKRWVPEYEQELLWNHTRRLREEREYRVRTVELKRASDEQKAKLMLARKKSGRNKSPGLFDFLAPRR